MIYTRFECHDEVQGTAPTHHTSWRRTRITYPELLHPIATKQCTAAQRAATHQRGKARTPPRQYGTHKNKEHECTTARSAEEARKKKENHAPARPGTRGPQPARPPPVTRSPGSGWSSAPRARCTCPRPARWRLGAQAMGLGSQGGLAGCSYPTMGVAGRV